MGVRFLWIFILAISLTSCQFTETMVLNEDGSGRMELSADLSEIMSMSGAMAKDSTMKKTDTIIAFKDILEEKKDSIAKLSPNEQKRLQAMKNYNIHMFSDPETNKMVMDVFTEFQDVSEADNLMKGFDLASEYMPGSSKNGNDSKKDSEEDEIIGVKFSYSNGHFKRDAFIRDKQRHQIQLDSLKKAESFMSSVTYKLKYTFPKKIKSTTAEGATFSLDGKTLELQNSFLEYMKNPDVFDVEVELED